ncbi:MAG: DUF2088 domain-containing protein [Firmicutes bacterium]|nr:DUF2088 domain-containing protein [Bacillota bacterium]
MYQRVSATPLGEDEIRAAVETVLGREELRGRRVLALLPDTTRTAPVAEFFRAFYRTVKTAGGRLDAMIALGTHPPLSRVRLLHHLGLSEAEYNRDFADCHLFNHAWDDPQTLTLLGRLTADQIATATGGLMAEEIPITVNRAILAYDLLLVLSPVVPHEVAGFSGGEKYFFPGISGEEIIDFFHWLGAVITIPRIIGVRENPVREVLRLAAALIPVPRIYFHVVMGDEGLRGIFAGTEVAAWQAAADLSATLHVYYKPRRYRSVLGMASRKYDDLWTAGKVAYKLDGIVEDGGELIIYAPHITEVSYTHGHLIDQAGYHVRDYFLTRMEQFRHIPGRIKAHSTHVKGTGTFIDGREEPRINVVLATGIPPERCRRINLGYRDPGTIDPTAWEGKEEEGLLLVREAGERLFRLRQG